MLHKKGFMIIGVIFIILAYLLVKMYLKNHRMTPRLNEIIHLPEQQLMYPGAIHTFYREKAEGTNYQGPFPAHTIRDYECTCAPVQVDLFYKQQLTTRGWVLQNNLPNNPGRRVWNRGNFII